MEELTDALLKLGDDIFSEIGDPLIMALNEGEILLLVGGEGIELGGLPALLVLLKVLGNMVLEEVSQQAELEIILVVELFALLGLHEVVAAILVAVLDSVLLEFFLAEGLLLKNDTILKLKLCTLKGLKSLSEIFNIYSPGG